MADTSKRGDNRAGDHKREGGRRKEETGADNITKQQQGKDTNRTLEKPNS